MSQLTDKALEVANAAKEVAQAQQNVEDLSTKLDKAMKDYTAFVTGEASAKPETPLPLPAIQVPFPTEGTATSIPTMKG